MGGGSTLRIRTVVTLATRQFVNSIGVLEHRTTRFQAFLKRSSMAMGAGSLAIAAGLGMAVKQAAKFEQNLANMQSVAKASGSEFKKLRKLALDMGKTTRMSATEAATAMYSLASAGQRYAEITKTLPGVIALATATQYDLAQTTDTVVGTLNAFGYEADQTDRVVNVFAATIGRTLGRMEKFQYSMKLLGPTAKDAGLGIEATSAALGVLYDANIDGSSAGAGLRRVLASLLSPSTTLRQRLDSVSISVSALDPRLHSLGDIMTTLRKAGLNAQTAFEDFGLRGAAAILALANAGDRLPELERQITGTDDAAGMAETQMDTLQGTLDHLRNVVQVLAITVGTELKDAVRKFADAAADMTEYVADSSEHMTEFQAKSLAATAGLLGFLAVAGRIPVVGTYLAALGTAWYANWEIQGLVNAKMKEWDDRIINMGPNVDDGTKRLWDFWTAFEALNKTITRFVNLDFSGGFGTFRDEIGKTRDAVIQAYRDMALAEQETGGGGAFGFRLWQGPELPPGGLPGAGGGEGGGAASIAARIAAVQAPLLEVGSTLRTLHTDTMDWAASLAEGTTVFEQFGVSGVEAAGYVLDAWRKMTEGQREALDQNLQMFDALSSRMAQAYMQFYAVTKKFGKAILNSLYQGFVGMLSMVVDKAIAEIMIEQAKTMGLLTISGFLNPANWAKIAPMLAAAAAAKAAIGALGTIHPKYHEGGLPYGMNEEMPVVVRPRREAIVDLFKAQRGGFGHTMVPALAGGEYNMTFNLNFGSTAPADVDWLDVTENLALTVREAMMGD